MSSTKFRNKYRINTVRLKNHDYSSNATYFITIVTKNRDNYFGKIINDEMILNEIGKIVYQEWYISEKIRNNIFLDEFIIMPNHIHGIVIVDNGNNGGDGDDVETLWHNVSTNQPHNANHRTNQPHNNNNITTNKQPLSTNIINENDIKQFMSKISPKKSSLSHMIREFKTAVTKKSRKISPDFAWQERFYEHIIRNEKELYGIQKYIIENPKNWKSDRNKY